MDTQSFYGKKRKKGTVRMAGGDEGESDEEVIEDSDSEYTPETELIGNRSVLVETDSDSGTMVGLTTCHSPSLHNNWLQGQTKRRGKGGWRDHSARVYDSK